MTRLLNFTKTKEKRREEKRGGFCVFWNEGEMSLYSSVGGNMNEMSFNEGGQGIMNLDLILALREI